MILIDTNVVSEPWKPAPDARVLAWLDAQAIETLFLSAVTVAELRFGIAAMPEGVTTRKWRICPTFKNVSGTQVGLTVDVVAFSALRAS